MATLHNSDIRVTILMATYNGAAYIETQLMSIIDQDYSNWELLIRDDGSTDHTVSVVNTFVEKDKRIRLIKDDKGNLGSCQNFSALLEQTAGAQYVMFADQDDKWMTAKVGKTLETMLDHENSVGAGIPVLAFSDFMYADGDLNPLFSSTRILPANRSLNTVLTENSIYGCTMMLNGPLVRLSQHIPTAAENHDYWVALIAASMGQKCHLSQETLLYRQHNKNVSGTYKDKSLLSRWQRITNGWESFKGITSRRVRMTNAFYDRFQDILPPENKVLIEKYLYLAGKGGLKAVYELNKLGINKGAFHKNILFYLSLLGGRTNNK